MKKVLLVVSLISVLLLAGCNKNEVNNNVPEVTNNEQQEEVDNNVTDVMENQQIQENINNNNEYISVLLDYSGEKGIYKIPYVNLKSSDAVRINDLFSRYEKIIKEDESISNSIPNLYSNELEEKIEALFEVGLAMGEVNYDFYVNGKILSLILKGMGDLETINVVAINFDIDTGKIISNDELLKYKSITFQDFNNQYPKILFDNIDYRDELLQEINASSLDEVMTYSGENNWRISAFKSDIESFNISNITMFMDSDGTINIFAPVYWFNAGAINRIIDTNI